MDGDLYAQPRRHAKSLGYGFPQSPVPWLTDLQAESTSSEHLSHEDRLQELIASFSRPKHAHRPEPGIRVEPADPPAVLARLRDRTLSLPNRRKCILEAEVVAFSENEIPELCKLLHDFIQVHRSSNTPDDLVAVGAAARKLVGYLPWHSFGVIATLLESTGRYQVPLDLELEIVKTLVWRLAADPPAIPDSEPKLGNALWELVATYVNPRLLGREKYGAVALNAVLATLLLQSRHTTECLQRVCDAAPNWFSTLVVRRIRSLLKDLCESPAFAKGQTASALTTALSKLGSPQHAEPST